MANRTHFIPSDRSIREEDIQSVGSLDPRLSRTHYFDGRLLTATDLNRDQIYLDERVLEIGRVLGSGIAKGLELRLSRDRRYIHVNTGLAISEAGRVLELTRPLKIDLLDHALISTLNRGRYRRFNRGLYAVTLQYVEMGSDSAEAYPADPTDKREFHFDSFSEGVEVGLTPLRYPLPSDNELLARKSLARRFLRESGQPRELSDQTVALGMVAIRNAQPQWLDMHLLRRPLRPESALDTWQSDLHAHYLELFERVMVEREASRMGGQFPASGYFHLLPPAGVLPHASVDPEHAVQHFFPEHYKVSISPVRLDDLPVLLKESMSLPPLDLDRNETAEILVLVPLDNLTFNQQARKLGFDADASPVTSAIASDKLGHINRWLHATDLITQRLNPPSLFHKQLDTKLESVWKGIWKAFDSEQPIYYLRRPVRAAEAQVSAVVLAQGVDTPDDTTGNTTGNAELDVLKEKLKETEAALDAREKALNETEEHLKKLQIKLKKLEEELGGRSAILDSRKTDIDKTDRELELLKSILEAKKNQLESDKKNQDERDRQLSDRDISLTDRLKGLDRRDVELVDRNKILEALDKKLKLQDAAIKTSNISLTTRESKLSESNRLLAELDAQLKTQEAELGRTRVDLNTRENEVIESNKALVALDNKLKNQKTVLDGRETTLLTGESALKKKETTFAEKSKASNDLFMNTLKTAEKKGRLNQFMTMVKSSTSSSDLAAKIKDSGTTLGLDTGTVNNWVNIGRIPGGVGGVGGVVIGGGVVPRGVSPQSLADEIEQILDSRHVTHLRARNAAIKLADIVAHSPQEEVSIRNIIEQIEPDFDEVLWPTLLKSHKNQTLDKFNSLLTKHHADPQALGKSIAMNGSSFSLTVNQSRTWVELGKKLSN